TFQCSNPTIVGGSFIVRKYPENILIQNHHVLIHRRSSMPLYRVQIPESPFIL
ncbi:hypothetical protein L9F63_004814, partial [Diploptera punctata]